MSGGHVQGASNDDDDGGAVTFPAVLVVLFVYAVLVYPWVDAAIARWRRERADLDRVGGRVVVAPRVPPPIRFDRDPSPRPRAAHDRHDVKG